MSKIDELTEEEKNEINAISHNLFEIKKEFLEISDSVSKFDEEKRLSSIEKSKNKINVLLPEYLRCKRFGFAKETEKNREGILTGLVYLQEDNLRWQPVTGIIIQRMDSLVAKLDEIKRRIAKSGLFGKKPELLKNINAILNIDTVISNLEKLKGKVSNEINKNINFVKNTRQLIAA